MSSAQHKNTLLAQAREVAGRATRLDCEHRYIEAQMAYADAGEAIIKAVSLETDARTKRILRQKAFEYIERAEKIQAARSTRQRAEQQRPRPVAPSTIPKHDPRRDGGTPPAPPAHRPAATTTPVRPGLAKPHHNGPRPGSGAPVQRVQSKPLPYGETELRPLDTFLSCSPTGTAQLTHVSTIQLEVGGVRYGGEFVTETLSLQRRLKALLHPEREPETGPPTSVHPSARRPGLHASVGTGGDREEDAGPQAPPDGAVEGPPGAPEQPAPPQVDEAGTIVGARADFHQDTAVQTSSSQDSGTFYRDREWNSLVRQPNRPRGPPQTPFAERISLAERGDQIVSSSREGTRVNPNSKERGYAIDGYETQSYIDESRSLDQPLPKGSGKAKASPAVTHSSVLWETAAVAAKIRNAHKVGGERVKEMDHFVASVETPSVNVQLPDVAPIVARLMEHGLEPVHVAGCRDAVTGEERVINLHVQPELRNADNGLSATVRRHAVVFYGLLSRVLGEFLQRPRVLQDMRVYYMATIRADACVCSRSAEDGRVYFNLLAFQQQQPLAKGHEGHEGHVLPRRVWQYWLQRAAMVLAEDGVPTGLYDPAVRRRFSAFAAGGGVDTPVS